MSTTKVETIDITPTWEFAATAYAMNLRNGEDFDVKDESQQEVLLLGRRLDAALAFIERQGDTRTFQEYLKGYNRGRSL